MINVIKNKKQIMDDAVQYDLYYSWTVQINVLIIRMIIKLYAWQ